MLALRIWLLGAVLVVLTWNSRVSAQEQYPKDWGVRGEWAVGEMPGLDAGGVPVDLYCAKDDTSITGLVIVVSENGAARSSVRALARHLASHGLPVMVPAQEQADPRRNATSLLRARSAIQNVILAFPASAPCARLRSCGESGGVVGGPTHCYKWTAPAPSSYVVVGSGVATYLFGIEQAGCEAGLDVHLLDPDTAGLPLPDLERCGLGVSRPFPGVNIVRAGLGRCHSGVDELVSGPFDTGSVEITTVHGARHCDAMPGDAACVARCGAGAGSGAPAYLFRYLTARLRGDFGSTHGWENRWLYPEQAAGRVSYEYREQSGLDSVTGFNVSGVFGIGGRDSTTDDLRIKAVAALRPELILGRRSTRSLGAGPYLEAGWLATSNVALGGGLSVLLPTGEDSALVPSLGVYAHPRDDAWQGGGSFGLFFGKRELNNISSFDAATGLRLEARADFSKNGERALFLAYQLDLTLIVAVAAFAGGV